LVYAGQTMLLSGGPAIDRDGRAGMGGDMNWGGRAKIVKWMAWVKRVE